jgi:hypothetical protein
LLKNVLIFFSLFYLDVYNLPTAIEEAVKEYDIKKVSAQYQESELNDFKNQPQSIFSGDYSYANLPSDNQPIFGGDYSYTDSPSDINPIFGSDYKYYEKNPEQNTYDYIVSLDAYTSPDPVDLPDNPPVNLPVNLPDPVDLPDNPPDPVDLPVNPPDPVDLPDKLTNPVDLPDNPPDPVDLPDNLQYDLSSPTITPSTTHVEHTAEIPSVDAMAKNLLLSPIEIEYFASHRVYQARLTVTLLQHSQPCDARNWTLNGKPVQDVHVQLVGQELSLLVINVNSMTIGNYTFFCSGSTVKTTLDYPGIIFNWAKPKFKEHLFSNYQLCLELI